MNNYLNNKNSIAITGLDNAIQLATVLMKNEYDVSIHNEDGDVYIISWCLFYSSRFIALDQDEQELIADHRLKENEEN